MMFFKHGGKLSAVDDDDDDDDDDGKWVGNYDPAVVLVLYQ